MEVEAVVNACPLVYVDEDKSSSMVLTPANFYRFILNVLFLMWLKMMNLIREEAYYCTTDSERKAEISESVLELMEK